MPFNINRENYLLLGVWLIIMLILLTVSFHYKSAADAIVAQVDPQRIAISYEKAVMLKSIRVIPGQDVRAGDTLLEVDRPDLLLDIEQSENKLKSLRIDRQKTLDEYNNRILSSEIDMHSKLFDIDQQISLVESRISSNKKLLQDLATLENENGITIDSLAGNNEIKLKRLKEEKAGNEKAYLAKLSKIEQEKISSLELIDNNISIHEMELSLLQGEKNSLIKVSPVNGTVGNVYSEIDELIKPYTTIISIYKAKPTVIKAYISERHRQEVSIGDKVLVESSNREYSIEGEIFEVGSRVTDFPQRLLENKLVLFGQEIFISIPENNKFLNGEKVYVKLKPGK